MGGITLVDTPSDPEGSLALPNGLFHALLKTPALGAIQSSPMPLGLNKDMNLQLLDSALANTTTASSTTTNNIPASALDLSGSAQATNNFSISDYLVPGLQTRPWEDWQGVDDLPDLINLDTQDFSSDLNAMPYSFGLDGIMGNALWDSNSVPMDQAYDEFVFDLAPSAFETPATVNIADLIVGPNSMAPSVSPQELTMPMDVNFNNYQDLALANLYGFTEPSNGFDSDSGSDLDDDEESDSDEEDDEDDSEEEENSTELEFTPVVPQEATLMAAVPEPALQAKETKAAAQSTVPASRSNQDPNKRRMEEALVARINNDLGPEHMAGLFQILKGSNDQEDGDEDEEMEVDLSRLDESTLVQVYQYVETCCMQTMGAILAAEERERAAVAAAVAAAEEAMERRRQEQRLYMERTPELSPCHSSASSSSPSPPHPSSKGGRRSNISSQKRSTSTSQSVHPYQDDTHFEESIWSATTAKSRRKKASNGAAAGVGGGGTGKGRRIQAKDQQHHEVFSIEETVVLLHAHHGHGSEEEMENEDEDIDVVGI